MDSPQLEYRWYDTEHTIMLWTFHSGWTWDWDKFRVIYLEIIALFRAETHPVASIWDLSEQRTPAKVLLSEIGSQMRNLPLTENFTGVVLISDNGFVRSMINIYDRIFNKGRPPVRVAESLVAAVAVVNDFNKKAAALTSP